MSDLYNTDLVLWSEHQATLLRRLAAGEVVNEPADWSGGPAGARPYAANAGTSSC